MFNSSYSLPALDLRKVGHAKQTVVRLGPVPTGQSRLAILAEYLRPGGTRVGTPRWHVWAAGNVGVVGQSSRLDATRRKRGPNVGETTTLGYARY